MKLTPYQRGIKYEHKARRELEERGYFVVRAAQSRGPADLVAIGPDHVLVIQVTARKRPHRTKIRDLQNLRLPPFCRKQVWFWMTRRGWEIWEVD